MNYYAYLDEINFDIVRDDAKHVEMEMEYCLQDERRQIFVGRRKLKEETLY